MREKTYETLSAQGYLCYDFFLPGLILDALESGTTAATLAAWAQEQAQQGIRTVNMLGCHDGIPLLDLKGLLPEERIESLIETVVARGGMVKDLHGQKNVYYQVNATYFSALGEDEQKLLFARAMQLFMPGKPQVWYLDLFAGKNDTEAVQRGGSGGHKEINRTNLTSAQVEEALQKQVVQDQLALLRMRNACPAFGFDSRPDPRTARRAPSDPALDEGGSTAALYADLETAAFGLKRIWRAATVPTCNGAVWRRAERFAKWNAERLLWRAFAQSQPAVAGSSILSH